VAKTIYGSLFQWIMNKLNKGINPTKSSFKDLVTMAVSASSQ
jgi:myosin heavy subunit